MSTQTPSGFGSGATPGDGSGSGIPDPSTTTVTVNDPGAGGPHAFGNFQPPAGHPNPFVDHTPFGVVLISGIPLPGIIESIDGCGTPEEWSQQKGTGGNFASSTWKGAKLAEKIKIKMGLFNASTYNDAYRVRAQLRPTRGVKPPSHPIVNPIVNWGGILRIVVDDIGFPKWVASGGYWTWEVDLNEYNPNANAKTGPADPTKPSDGSTPGGAQGAESKYVLGKTKDA